MIQYFSNLKSRGFRDTVVEPISLKMFGRYVDTFYRNTKRNLLSMQHFLVFLPFFQCIHNKLFRRMQETLTLYSWYLNFDSKTLRSIVKKNTSTRRKYSTGRRKYKLRIRIKIKTNNIMFKCLVILSLTYYKEQHLFFVMNMLVQDINSSLIHVV